MTPANPLPLRREGICRAPKQTYFTDEATERINPMSDDPYEKRAEAARREYYAEREIDATMPHEPESAPISAPTDRTETAEQIATRRQPEIGNVLYAWQMQVAGGWNIIGLQMGNASLPLVTTSMPMAWEAFEVAQAHANRNQCQVRLATFVFDSLAAVVEPNDE